MASQPKNPRIQLAERIGEFRYDPLKHALFSYPWGTADLKEPGPRTWQREMMQQIAEHLANPATRHTPCRISRASGHGIGKALAHGEPVLTPLGWKPIEEIQVGEMVISVDGAATRVTGVWPQGERDVFRVTLDDGCSVVVDADHLWQTSTRADRKEDRYRRKKPGTVKTTREITATLTHSNGVRRGLNHQLPSLCPVKHPRTAVPIEPYLLGCYLGDGDAQGRITGMDEGFDLLIAAGAGLGMRVRKTGTEAVTRTILGAAPALRALSLWGCRAHEKFIPECYLRGSIEQRTAVLQGLLDTDGTINKNNAVVFEITAPRLAEDAAELVRSLGGVVRRTEKMGSYSGKICRKVYRLFISLPQGVQPFRLPRKLARYAPAWGKGNAARTRHRHIVSVEPEGCAQATCIAVEHSSHLFVTRDHIVTHNSAGMGMLNKWALDTCIDTRCVITANTESQLLTKTSPELAKWARLAITRDWFRSNATSIVSTLAGHEKSWRTDLVTWSENNIEAFAGLHNMGRRIMLMFDEASGIVDKVWEVSMGALTDENTEIIWLAFGNPTLNTGMFRETFGKYRNLWKGRQIDSRTVEGTNKAYLQEIVDTYGEDSDIAKVRVRGMFPSASSMQFIPIDIIEAAQAREGNQPLASDPVIFGVDCARFGDDHSTLAIRCGRDAKTRPWKRWSKTDTMLLASDIALEAQRYHPDMIFVDAGNIGAAIVDRLRQITPDTPVTEVWFGGAGRDAELQPGITVRTKNKRAEIWTKMRAWLAGGAIPADDQLRDDLIGPLYGFDSNEALQLERKVDMKKRGLVSPDDADALACTFSEPVMPRLVPGYLDPWNTGVGGDRYGELD